MIARTLIAAAGLALLAAAPAGAAAPCKDAKGKFVKCGTPGAKPA